MFVTFRRATDVEGCVDLWRCTRPEHYDRRFVREETNSVPTASVKIEWFTHLQHCTGNPKWLESADTSFGVFFSKNDVMQYRQRT
mmetsp:Transcript_39684/g.95781  ORF Transcript_39684/g.95781 Transcript_39684/m.95781 type:complete len:85 (-) Transcript_39684:111-365(-)